MKNKMSSNLPKHPLPSATMPTNAYTDRPALHPNWLLGALQIQVWLLFHPSAWRNYMAGRCPGLDVDFVLGDLKPAHWRDPGLQRLLILTYGVWPCAVGVIIALVLWLIGAPHQLLLNVFAGITYTSVAS